MGGCGYPFPHPIYALLLPISLVMGGCGYISFYIFFQIEAVACIIEGGFFVGTGGVLVARNSTLEIKNAGISKIILHFWYFWNRDHNLLHISYIHSKSEKVYGTAFSVKNICGKSA